MKLSILTMITWSVLIRFKSVISPAHVQVFRVGIQVTGWEILRGNHCRMCFAKYFRKSRVLLFLAKPQILLALASQKRPGISKRTLSSPFGKKTNLHSSKCYSPIHVSLISHHFISHHFIYPLTARAVGAAQMILQPDSPIFPCSPLPSGNWRTPGMSIP